MFKGLILGKIIFVRSYEQATKGGTIRVNGSFYWKSDRLLFDVYKRNKCTQT